MSVWGQRWTTLICLLAASILCTALESQFPLAVELAAISDRVDYAFRDSYYAIIFGIENGVADGEEEQDYGNRQ